MKHYPLILLLVIMPMCVVAEPVSAIDVVEEQLQDVRSGPEEGTLESRFKQSETVTTKYLLWVLFVLIVGIVISIIGIYWLKMLLDRKNSGTESKRVEILSVRRLSTKLNVFVIKVDSTEYIITSSNDASTITRHRDIDE